MKNKQGIKGQSHRDIIGTMGNWVGRQEIKLSAFAVVRAGDNKILEEL